MHAWLTTAHVDSWMRYGSAGLACVPPLALLASTHSMAILWRFNPTPPPDATSQVRDGALASATARIANGKLPQPKSRTRYCRTVPTTKVAHALRYLYDHRPAMSLRAIGATPRSTCTTTTWARSAPEPPPSGTAPGAARTQAEHPAEAKLNRPRHVSLSFHQQRHAEPMFCPSPRGDICPSAVTRQAGSVIGASRRRGQAVRKRASLPGGPAGSP